MINISLPDGSVRAFDKPVSGAEIAASIGPGLAKAALAFKVDGEMKDLSSVVDHDAKIGIVTSRDPDALELLRHRFGKVGAQAGIARHALQEHRPDLADRLGIG